MDFDTIHSPIDCRLLVAICDLTNFARLSRDKPSKDIFDIMSRYFELSGDIVEKAGQDCQVHWRWNTDRFSRSSFNRGG